MTGVTATCTVCKETASATAKEGNVSHIHIVHERWCSFFQAVSLGPKHAEMWIKSNGYPIEYRDLNGNKIDTGQG